MSSEALYREVILDYASHPVNDEIGKASMSSVGHNALCGDRVEFTAEVHQGAIQKVACITDGCAICRASGAMMCNYIRSLTTQEAAQLAQEMRQLMHKQSSETIEKTDLFLLSGVADYPNRVKCALLPWVALEDALKGHHESA